MNVRHMTDTIMFSKPNALNVVHVTGTKGKGSTCAYVEAALRSVGLTTGLFTSPHLIHPRERIRINNEPLSNSDFNHRFWTCWHRLLDSGLDETQLPYYFRYITLMGLMEFVEKNVDVAIVEVGIGGRKDSTNVL
eukprot:TRINITY_DN6111_c0_g1_i2.p1 TRINITY_DN6111_c0_g1~~TRINITY_DN6111_c0_g1_i2.p1  ORF type:complete len:135 (-),score=28.21 TRINITY_DN6111_c0_g1_i2:291-695(-)